MTAASGPGSAVYFPPRAKLAKSLQNLSDKRVLTPDDGIENDHPDATTYGVTLDGLRMTMSSAGEDYSKGVFTITKIGSRLAITFVPSDISSEALVHLMGPAAESLLVQASDLWREMQRPQPSLSPVPLTRSSGTYREKRAIVCLARQMATLPKRLRSKVIPETKEKWKIPKAAAERVWNAAVVRGRKINPDHVWDRPTGRPPKAAKAASKAKHRDGDRRSKGQVGPLKPGFAKDAAQKSVAGTIRRTPNHGSMNLGRPGRPTY